MVSDIDTILYYIADNYMLKRAYIINKLIFCSMPELGHQYRYGLFLV